jgi:hypothetical protein
LLTADAHQPGDGVCARFGLRSAASLDDVPDEGPIPGCTVIPASLLEACSGPGLAVPELACGRDREILARTISVAPALASEDGWGLHFGRELNATDDRRLFASTGMPVLEGKLIEPFAVHVERARQFIDPLVASRILGGRARFDRPRLGYREVASSTNRLTLIAAIIPAGAVTTHTIFCAKRSLEDTTQWFLCGILNSFAANYLVRLRGGTHVTAAMMDLLRVPRPARTDPAFRAIAALARRLSGDPQDTHAYVELQAHAAQLYGFTQEEFDHVLATFPLIPADVRQACSAMFRSAS